MTFVTFVTFGILKSRAFISQVHVYRGAFGANVCSVIRRHSGCLHVKIVDMTQHDSSDGEINLKVETAGGRRDADATPPVCSLLCNSCWVTEIDIKIVKGLIPCFFNLWMVLRCSNSQRSPILGNTWSVYLVVHHLMWWQEMVRQVVATSMSFGILWRLVT